MSKDGQGTKRRRKIAENFNRLSRVHERYRRQSDGQATAFIANAKNSASVTFTQLYLQATIALCAIVPCGVSLSNAAHASQSPQSKFQHRRTVAVRDVSLSQLAARIHQAANCHRARPAAAVR